MNIKVYIVILFCSLHILLGLISFIVGLLSSAQSKVWVAHTISPMWSGAFFVITGLTGMAMCRQKSQYSILCFTALNAITFITTVVNMQLLRLGLVNYTTLGKTFQKENKDIYIIIGMFIDGLDGITCLICLLLSIKLKEDAKNNRFKSNRKEGAFYVQIVSEKDIVLVQSKKPSTNFIASSTAAAAIATVPASLGNFKYNGKQANCESI